MTERELAKGAARKLAIIRHAEEVTGNVAQTCRYFGITRQAYYKWLRRYEELGPDGLRDRSRRRTLRRSPYSGAVFTTARLSPAVGSCPGLCRQF